MTINDWKTVDYKKTKKNFHFFLEISLSDL